MNICSNGHSEIAYTDWTCPLCDLQTDLAQLRSNCEAVEQELNNTEDALAYYQAKYDDYRNVLSNIAPEHLL